MATEARCANCGSPVRRPNSQRCSSCGFELRSNVEVPTPHEIPVAVEEVRPPVSLQTNVLPLASDDREVDLFVKLRQEANNFRDVVSQHRGQAMRNRDLRLRQIEERAEELRTRATVDWERQRDEFASEAARIVAHSKSFDVGTFRAGGSRDEVISLGWLTPTDDPKASNRIPCFVPLLNRGNLHLRVGKVDDARELVLATVYQLLEQSEPGQVVFDIVDPSLTSICAPLGRLRDINTAVAATFATTPTEVSATVNRLQSMISATIQKLQGKWESLGDFLDDRRGEEKDPCHVLVVLGWPSNEWRTNSEGLNLVLERGPKFGVNTILVDDGWFGEWSSPDFAREVVDLRGTPRWMRFPAMYFWADSARTTEDLRLLCERVAREALVGSAPLIELSSLLEIGQPVWTSSSADRIEVSIGRSGSEPVTFTLGDSRENTHNILIGGTVGTGKSNLLLTMIYSIAQRYSPEEVEMYLLDFKEGVEFARFADERSFLPHAKAVGIQADARLGRGVLRGLLSELERRSRAFLAEGVTNVAAYRAKSGHVMSRILLVVDEFQELFNDDGVAHDNGELLETIVRRGRSFGIHVVLASQTLTGIKGMALNKDAIFDQFRIRIALRLNRYESTVVLSSMNFEASELRHRGEAILNTESGAIDGNRRVVIAYASDESVNRLDEQFHSIWNGAPPQVVQRGVLASDSQYVLALTRASEWGTGIVGMPLVIGDAAYEVDGLGQAGRHVMMVGDGDDEGVGIIHAMTDSLALGLAASLQIVVIGRLHAVAESKLDRVSWIHSLQSTGAEVCEINDFDDLGSVIDRRSTDRTLVVVLGANDIPEGANRSSMCGISGMKSILAGGHSIGVSLVGWWQNTSSLISQLGFDWEKQVLIRICLRADAATVRQVTGSPWKSEVPPPGRAIFRDISRMPDPESMIPFGPQVFPRSVQ